MELVSGIIGVIMVCIGVAFVICVLLALFFLYQMCISDDNCMGCNGYPESCAGCKVYNHMEEDIKEIWLPEDKK